MMVRPVRILEVGTFTGYSAINLAMGLAPATDREPAGVLHTIEVNPEQEEGIRSFIREAGMEEQIVLHIGDALGIIPGLSESWDLVFIDADKPNYLNYYRMILPKVRTGGIIIADNVLWDGKVLGDREKMDRDTRGICEFNEFVRDDLRVEKMILPFRDGLMIARKL
jgi:predicted O-methyltransferase YrrM